jgi:bile acid:Na+ symporter, BASS family
MLQRLLTLTIVIFMVGNLLEVGLKVNLREVGKALRNVRFVALSLLWSFVLCPALAYLLTQVIPLEEPYAIGLLFLGMTPCAPFLPMVAQKARGDLAYVALIMLVTAVGTVMYLPLAVPVLVKGFAADAWTIGRPLVLFIAVPLTLGIAVRLWSEVIAERSHPIVKTSTGINTLIMLILIMILYGKSFASAIGTYAIGAQILFYAVVTAAAYGSGFGLAPGQKSVLALGVSTRNIGAAIAPLFSVADTDPRAITMCALAVPITLIMALCAARCLRTPP